MNKGIWFLAIAGVLTVTGCSQQKQAEAPAVPAVQEQAQDVAKQAQVVADQAKTTAEEAAKAADQAKVNAQEVAKNVSKQISDLLAKAKSLVDSGKFDEAIAQAQEVLKLDANNADAKSIIETAKEKLSALAQQKVADVKQGLADKFGKVGK